MIKAVFFDWFNTLARYDPPRENIQSQALQEFGINIPPQKIVTGLLVADRNYLEENAVSPVRKRSPAEQDRIFTRYQRTILTEAGINIAEGSDILVKILKRAQQLSQGLTFTLFDDVLPALKLLKARNLVLGLLSNIDKDMSPVCRELELEPYLDFTVTSAEVGVDKPEPPVFLTALKKARVDPAEAVHVGDQYQIDIIGARGVGINPILIDRYDLYREETDCPRIRSLDELTDYLQ